MPHRRGWVIYLKRLSSNRRPACLSLRAAMHRPPPGRTVTVSTQGEPFQAFVPAPLPPQPPLVPPADQLAGCLNAFERFLHDNPEPTSPLLRAALAHGQFETIHPFLDGNGRIGRSLIVLQLVADGLLREPLLYPSLFFKAHRPLYDELLNAVRLQGDWARWLDFFAEAVATTAAQAVHTAQALLALVAADRARLATLGRATPSAWTLHDALQHQPVTSAAALVAATGLTAATVNKTLVHLQQLGLVSKLTQRQRGRVFAYRDYVALLSAELDGPALGSPGMAGAGQTTGRFTH